MVEPLYSGAFRFRGFGRGGEVFMLATEKGLCRITWPEEDSGALAAWRDKHMPGAEIREEPERLRTYALQVEQYLQGSRTCFSLPLDLRGTPFQQSVWEELQRIPFGRTLSYTELAAAVGRPKAVRAVGTANGSNPLPLVVPCHRVIGKNGGLTGFRGGLDVKAELLRLEGFEK